MSDTKQLPGLLDGLVVGEAMSEHHGIRCCPALKEETDERYIVKIVSIPASQTQLDALLLSGAYKSKEDAQSYFRQLSEEIETEIHLLDKMGKLEGFLPHDGHQTIELPTGFRVVMLSPYRPSLARMLRAEPLTHLDAVNLGLDMCAALTAARRNGYLYADLKPENIFYVENKGYCISDLGFIPLASLKYASLPEKYRSSYTAPEITDDYSALNDRLDVYALGLVLYQVYNNGELPSEDFSAPMYADYEMAEIIMKACHPTPTRRWANPAQMGQELVNYMQRNSINDTPIVPPPENLPDEPQEEDPPFLTEDENEAEFAQLLAMIPEEDTGFDDTAENADASSPDDSADVEAMLAQADELLAMELPEPVVAPDPIDIPIPPPLTSEPEPEIQAQEEITEAAESSPSENETDIPPENAEVSQDEPEERNDDDNEDEDWLPPPPKKHRFAAIAMLCAIALLIAGTIFGISRYYHRDYLQNIDALQVNGIRDQITVSITADIDESLLTVVCTDAYGNALRSPVADHTAVFTNLNPGTQYKIHLEISGNHKLTGRTTGSYTTAQETQILNFTAITGQADGSAVFSFTVNGPDSSVWYLDYSDGSSTQSLEFRGHKANVSGLTVGQEYTFTLRPQDELFVTGQHSITHTAAPLIIAQQLRLQSYTDGVLTIQWDCAESTIWTVQCKNDRGFEQTVTTDTCSAQFTVPDTDCPYLIIVTAQEMSQNQVLTVDANPVNVTSHTIQALTPWLIEVTWEYEGTAPQNGWELSYTLDSGESLKLICAEPTAQIHVLPGSHCQFTVTPLHDGPSFGLTFSHNADLILPFPGISESAGVTLFAVPQAEEWKPEDLTEPKTVFAPDEAVCLLLSPIGFFDEENVSVSFVVTGNANTLVSQSTADYLWADLVTAGQELLLYPQLPTQPGAYTLHIYINNQSAASIDFQIQPATEQAEFFSGKRHPSVV